MVILSGNRWEGWFFLRKCTCHEHSFATPLTSLKMQLRLGNLSSVHPLLFARILRFYITQITPSNFKFAQLAHFWTLIQYCALLFLFIFTYGATVKRIDLRDRIQHKQLIVILRELDSSRLDVFFCCYESSYSWRCDFSKLWYPCFFENVILMRESTVLVPNIKLANFLLYLRSLNI